MAKQTKAAKEALEMVATYVRLRETSVEKLGEWFGCEVQDAEAHLENYGQNVAEALSKAGLTYDDAFVMVAQR